MTNKLFIICPFSCMESVLQYKYGNDIFFLTSVGAVLEQEFEYLIAVKDFIHREKIKTIYLVNDTSCRFMKGIINKNKLSGFRFEKVIEELYVEHYFSVFKDQSLFNQQFNLAKLNVLNQADEMKNSTILGNYISECSIEIKGLITSKENNLYKEIKIEEYTTKELAFGFYN